MQALANIFFKNKIFEMKNKKTQATNKKLNNNVPCDK
jgi:hypothetical protein